MSSSASDATPPLRIEVNGRVVAAVAVAVIALVLVVARLSPAAFIGTVAAALIVVAYAAHRWPLPTLVASAIATLADPVLMPRLLPSGVDLGPIGASEPLLAVAGVVVIADALHRGTFIPALRDPVLPLALLFIALAGISALANATPGVVAALGIVMTVDALAVYFAARMIPMGVRSAALAIAAVVAAAVAVALFGIAQVVLDPNLLGFFSFEGRFGEGGRITSFLGNPNMVAAVLGLTLPFALHGSRHLEKGRQRWTSRVVLFVLVLALLLTFSRGAWIGVGFGAVIGAVLVDWRSVLVLAVTTVLAWGVATVMPRNLALADGADPPDPVVPDLIDSTADRFGSLGGEDLRIRFISDGLPIVRDHLLLGAGPGRYGGAAASIIPSPIYEEYDTGLFGFRTVHNFWLHLLGETGVLGTSAFLAMVVGLLIRFVRAAKRETGLRFVLLAGAAGTLLVASFNSLTEMVFEGNMPVLLVWVIVGIASTLAPTRSLFGPRSSADG